MNAADLSMLYWNGPQDWVDEFHLRWFPRVADQLRERGILPNKRKLDPEGGWGDLVAILLDSRRKTMCLLDDRDRVVGVMTMYDPRPMRGPMLGHVTGVWVQEGGGYSPALLFVRLAEWAYERGMSFIEYTPQSKEEQALLLSQLGNAELVGEKIRLNLPTKTHRPAL